MLLLRLSFFHCPTFKQQFSAPPKMAPPAGSYVTPVSKISPKTVIELRVLTFVAFVISIKMVVGIFAALLHCFYVSKTTF